VGDTETGRARFAHSPSLPITPEMIRVNNQYDVEWQAGMTVQDLLDGLKFSFRMIVVKINGQVVLRPDFATTPVPEGAEVQAIHLIGGG